MVFQIAGTAAAELWPALLELRRALCAAGDDAPSHATLSRGAASVGSWRVTLGAEPAPDAVEVVHVPLDDSVDDARWNGGPECFSQRRLEAGGDPFVTDSAPLDPDARAFLRAYLPVILGAHRARRRGRLFLTAHLAQTLDGRIACESGHSQWISNEANLHHAHRLRALHDAVMVGRRTVEKDDPQLTVRHVDGESPARVVLNGSASLLRGDEDPGFGLFQGEGAARTTLVASTAAAREIPAERRERFRILEVDAGAGGAGGAGGSGNERPHPRAISQALFESGFGSVFLEGGGGALSAFLEHRAIDLLHVHVAPMILGSGVSGFSLPEVPTLDGARRLRFETFALDGELLLECRELAGGDA